MLKSRKMSRRKRSERNNQDTPEADAPRNEGAAVHAGIILDPTATKNRRKSGSERLLAGLSGGGAGGRSAHFAHPDRVDLQERATGYLEAVREADCRGNAHGRRSSRGASSSTSSAGAAPVTVLDENGANLGPPTMTGAAPLGVQSPTPTRPPAPNTSMPASVDPFENSMSKGTRIVDLEAFLPKISKHMCCRFCAEARLKQYLRVFAAYYDRHLEALDLWKWNTHKRPDPEEVSRSFIARRNASGATSYKHIPSHEIIKKVPYGLASVLLFRCSGLSIRGSVSGFTHIGGHRHRFTACTSQRVHKSGLTPTASFVVNQRIALAAMANGKMAGEMHNLLATMDVPLRQNFAFKGRTWLPAWRARRRQSHRDSG